VAVPSFDIAQLQPLLAALFFPFVRVGACLMVAPVFGASYVPARLRIVLAGAITLLIAPLLPKATLPALLSVEGFTITAEQLVIGATIGFVLQVMFDALAMGGQLLANGMGLGFALNLDPLRGVSTPALGQLYVVLGTLTFLALDGHLALLQVLVDSFRGLPVNGGGFDLEALRLLSDWGSALFSGALRISLPGITALLVTNLAFGVVSRAAPSLNLFAVGLPVTLAVGIAVVLYGLPMMQTGLIGMLGDCLQFLRSLTGSG
jgi:flagellar biosynthetic protein FliR